ncbi:MAG: DUF1566 domain-containing protein [Planctomycetota bacterium]|nr:DUF1566 domain-containing protein [Planctomycetota bacterium]
MEKLNTIIFNPRFGVLPKTGQVISYQTGDDGTYQVGWKKGRLNSNNQTRFVAKTIAGNAVILDYATRLMWPAADEVAGAVTTWTWVNAVAYAQVTYNSVNGYAGFLDWRLPNFYELTSLFDFNATNLKRVSFNLATANYWTSTTNPDNTAGGMAVRFSATNVVTTAAKTSAYAVRLCRNF